MTRLQRGACARRREAAWINAPVLWGLLDTPLLRDDFLARLDRLTGFAGRGLLVPRVGQTLLSCPPFLTLIPDNTSTRALMGWLSSFV